MTINFTYEKRIMKRLWEMCGNFKQKLISTFKKSDKRDKINVIFDQLTEFKSMQVQTQLT